MEGGEVNPFAVRSVLMAALKLDPGTRIPWDGFGYYPTLVGIVVTVGGLIAGTPGALLRPPIEWAATLPVTQFYFRLLLLFNEEHTVTKNYHLDLRTGGTQPMPVSWVHGHPTITRLGFGLCD